MDSAGRSVAAVPSRGGVHLAWFLLALGAGSGSIYALPGMWLLPALVVAAYTGLLCVQHSRSGSPPGDTLRDSPYYLGFLLTQIALVALFLRFRPAFAADLTQLSLGLGTALSTSIVGLTARQILVMMTATADRREERPEHGTDRLRRTLADQQDIQRDFVAFVEQFLAHREQLMESEKAASAKYVRSVRSTLSSLERVQTRVAEHIEESARQTSELLDQGHRSILEAATGTADALTSNNRVVRDRLAALGEEIANVTRGLQQASPAVELDAVRGASAETAEALRMLGGVGVVLGRTAGEASTAATAIRDDLKAIDGILTEFVEIAVKRIHELDRIDGNLRLVDVDRVGRLS